MASQVHSTHSCRHAWDRHNSCSDARCEGRGAFVDFFSAPPPTPDSLKFRVSGSQNLSLSGSQTSQARRLSGPQTLRTSDSQTLSTSRARDLWLSNSQTLMLPYSQPLRVSELQVPRLSRLQALGLSRSHAFRLSELQTLGPWRCSCQLHCCVYMSGALLANTCTDEPKTMTYTLTSIWRWRGNHDTNMRLQSTTNTMANQVYIEIDTRKTHPC